MSKTSYPLRLPPQLKRLLEDKSEYMGISLNALIVQALWELAEREGRGGANVEDNS